MSSKENTSCPATKIGGVLVYRLPKLGLKETQRINIGIEISSGFRQKPSDGNLAMHQEVGELTRADFGRWARGVSPTLLNDTTYLRNHRVRS